MRILADRILLNVVILGLGTFANSSAFADLASGTPHFTCTAPTLNTDGTAVTATGPLSIAKYTFYIDGVSKKVTATGICDWQTIAGDIAPGAHNAQATATNAAGQESAKTNQLPFTVPQPAPLAPSGLTVQ